MLKCSSIVLGLVVASMSHASFELLTLNDRLNHRVVRFDPVNQIMLGTYGSGYYGNEFSISTVNNSTMVWDFGQARTFVFDAGTGVLQTEIPHTVSGGIGSELSNGMAISLTNSGISTYYSTTGSVLFNFPAWAASVTYYVNVAETNTHYYQFCSGINQLRRFRKSDGVNDLNWTNPNLGSGFLIWDVTMIQLNGVNRMVLPNRNNNSVRLLDADGSGAIGFTLGTLAYITGVAKGHGNILYFSGETSTGRTQIVRYNYASNFSSVILDVPNTTYQFEGMSSVVAPEPATLLPIGLGLAVLLGKRRKASR